MTRSVSNDVLSACRLDPAYEARHGIYDIVICRLCGAQYTTHISGKHQHLHRHHPQQAAIYSSLFPCAPTAPITATAKHVGKTPEQVAQQRADSFLIPRELAECRADPGYEERKQLPEEVVYCRICGKRLAWSWTNHGKTIHRMTSDEYRNEYLHAPVTARANKKFKRPYTAQDYERLAELHEEFRRDPKRRAERVKKNRIKRLAGRETREGLMVFRSDPGKERREGLPYVVCRECGEHHKDLARHFRLTHNKLKEYVYLARWSRNGIEPPTHCFRQKTSDLGKRRWAKLKAGIGGRPRKTRGRRAGTMLPRTKALILLAGYYSEIVKKTKYGMALDLYPAKSIDDVENSRQSTYDLFDRWEHEIGQERTRLAALPEEDRNLEVEKAKQVVSGARKDPRSRNGSDR